MTPISAPHQFSLADIPGRGRGLLAVAPKCAGGEDVLTNMLTLIIFFHLLFP